MVVYGLEIVQKKGKANYPYLVQRKNTENWNTSAGFKDKQEAIAYASKMASKYHTVPWRIAHYTGGSMTEHLKKSLKEVQDNFQKFREGEI